MSDGMSDAHLQARQDRQVADPSPTKELTRNNDGTVNLTDEDFHEIMWQRVPDVELIIKAGGNEYRVIGFNASTNSYVLIRL